MVTQTEKMIIKHMNYTLNKNIYIHVFHGPFCFNIQTSLFTYINVTSENMYRIPVFSMCIHYFSAMFARISKWKKKILNDIFLQTK